MTSNLLATATSALPNELALVVIDHLQGNNKALCALARTCRDMQNLAEERLYKRIELLSVKNLHAIIEAFTSRPERVRAVQTLKILYSYKDDSLKDSAEIRTTFNECVARMVNLREWHIESPYDNFHWENDGGQAWVNGDMQRFRRALDTACVEGPIETAKIAAERRLGKNLERTVGLGLLENLTIHSHGTATDFWNLEGFHCLFRHPALKHLHVSCVAFPDSEISELATHTKKTPLTSLIFDECELRPKSLLSILRTPARLKSLTLGENVFNINRSRRAKPLLNKDAGVSLEALSAVAHSLESLTHLNPGWRLDKSPQVLRSIRPPGDGMRDFHLLKYLECDTNSFLHQAIIMNRDLAPPSLETLRIRRHWDVPVDFWDQPPDFDHYAALPSLDTLELLQSSYMWLDTAKSEYICDEERLRNRHAKAFKLHKAGINLKMSLELHKSEGLIPPYLHKERVPIIECLYDASMEGFKSFIRKEVTDEDGEMTESLAREEAETDQLSEVDISLLKSKTRRLTLSMKHSLVNRGGRLPSFREIFGSDDGSEESADSDEDFEVDDLDEDDDMALDLELDDDVVQQYIDEDGNPVFDEDGNPVFEDDGELFTTVWEVATEDDYDSDMDEDTDEDDDDDEMHDALETQQQPANTSTNIDDVD
ncbi:uncharacterized protein J4E79_007282 [Alternaria viburni]|uniref:uncharacterized protein n=1 Tax=Alternaria viburni TaxID=566460 RepID=UPI0020C428F4|nr:uncharacterized protein J4E79_007282 [Alternaria viburni]KAI4658300.1 hypothetical protein J4E79_007282 [Alternaria viburni]